MLGLMSGQELSKYEETCKKDFANVQSLEVYYQLNLRLRQQISIKLSIIEDMLSQRRPDYKSKQFVD